MIMKTKNLLLIALSLFMLAACNNENQTDEANNKETEQQADDDAPKETAKKQADIKTNQASEIDAELIGNWDLLPDIVYEAQADYLVITDKLIVKEGSSISGTTGNKLIAKDGKISYDFMDETVYLYDYKIQNDTLYWLSSPGKETKDPVNSPRSIKLIKGN
jgi:hypothetical protein